MKTILFIILFACCLALHSQQAKFKVQHDRNIDHPFFHTNDSIYNPLTLVFKDEAGRLHYDNVVDSNKYAVQTNIILNGDVDRHIQFGEYRRGDAIDFITLSGESVSEYVELRIAVEGNKIASATIHASTPALGTADLELTSLELILNVMYPERGELVKGKISFKAVCKEKCGYKTYEGEGYFKFIP